MFYLYRCSFLELDACMHFACIEWRYVLSTIVWHVGTNTSVIMLCECAELILQVLVSKTVIMLCECAELILHVMSCRY